MGTVGEAGARSRFQGAKAQDRSGSPALKGAYRSEDAAVEHREFRCQSSDGTQLYFQSWEPASKSKAVVCLVHGLGEHSGRYGHVGAAFTNAGYALLGFDLRGHGKSGGPRGHAQTYEALMGDIDRLLAEAAERYPGQPRFLYGHSLGGGLVLNYLVRRQPAIAGAIASGPWLRLNFEPPALQIKIGRLMDRLYPAFSMGNGLDMRALSHDPAVVRAYEGDPLVHDRISAHLAMSMMDAGEWCMGQAAECHVPLLVVHGGADRITSMQASQQFAQQVKGDCTFKAWEGLYHETHNEPQKQEVLKLLTDLLDAHCPAGVG
jgi:alpha-beta hydrolase superfamily lysophospholipase